MSFADEAGSGCAFPALDHGVPVVAAALRILSASSLLGRPARWDGVPGPGR